MQDPTTRKHEARRCFGDEDSGLVADVRVTWRDGEDPARVRAALTEALRLLLADLPAVRPGRVRYGTGSVEGDLAIPASSLQPGYRLRWFDGLHDTVTVVSVTMLPGQYGVRRGDVVLSDGTRLTYVPETRLFHLALGPDREPETSEG